MFLIEKIFRKNKTSVFLVILLWCFSYFIVYYNLGEISLLFLRSILNNKFNSEAEWLLLIERYVIVVLLIIVILLNCIIELFLILGINIRLITWSILLIIFVMLLIYLWALILFNMLSVSNGAGIPTGFQVGDFICGLFVFSIVIIGLIYWFVQEVRNISCVLYLRDTYFILSIFNIYVGRVDLCYSIVLSIIMLFFLEFVSYCLYIIIEFTKFCLKKGPVA